MRMLTVTDSDIIEAVGFNPTDKDKWLGTLGVVFKSSASDVYLYEGVRYEVYVNLTSADSIGKSFHELFRKTKYPFTKSARPTLNK